MKLLLLNSNKIIKLVIVTIVLILLIGMSIIMGYTHTSIVLTYEAFTSFDGSNEHLIIQTVRLPRALIAACVGASLAIAGVYMQTLTRNPLASPGIFGINAGASFAVVCVLSVFNVSSLNVFTWVAFLGAAVAALAVYFVGGVGRQGLTPMKITLAGAAITALFSSFTQGILVTNEAALDEVLFWLAGSIQGRSLTILVTVFPYILIGWLLALIMTPMMNVLAMGDDVAKGLGLKVGLLKLMVGLIVILLAGGSVAIAGPIGFIGIVIPHIARSLIGTDHRWLVPFAGLLGGVLLLAADIGARYIVMPQEVPVGVMTAFIGTPFFIYIARKGFNKR
ncbi:iron ABC transporter permease [Salipaludibacillus agaradhaerens]|uniref:FecCD family ABC transporter permease n=1 Tax=Salipaludibacillus agaradhaerens TaxID=76935 RepID=UPI002150E8DA|nr:iron ABC transporter permease [Salipaludibacillus agaradhaerens]MCR6108491.1 iron ABC transporter permease [Salipaludibacillus agaradhaerens]MCR6120512.1 iron ABC transporter permease [Salipaludibacillus agaradhaerens]